MNKLIIEEIALNTIVEILNVDYESLRIDYLSSGRTNDVYVISSSLEPSSKIILKKKKVQYGQSNYSNEKNIINYLRSNDILDVPQIYYLDSKFCIQEYIEGKVMDCCSSIKSYYELGKLISKVHNIVAKPSSRFNSNIDIFANIDRFYKLYFNDVLRKTACYFPEETELVRVILKNTWKNDCYTESDIALIHHDLHLRNVLVRNDHPCLIDWESSRYEVSEVEFVKIKHLNVSSLAKEQITAFIDGYQVNRKFRITSNFICHEVIWLIKMMLFEFENHNEDDIYFPSLSYYCEKIYMIYYTCIGGKK